MRAAYFDYDVVSPEIALHEADNMIIDLKLQFGVSARQICTLCFWLSKAQVGGKIKDLAVHPDRPTDKSSTPFDFCCSVG